MIRLFLQVSTNELKSLDRGRSYLAYLLIRNRSKTQAGGFSLNLFLEATGLKERAGKAMLSCLIEKGFVLKEQKGHYRIKGHKSLCGRTGKKYTCVSVSDEEFSKFSLKKIATFRAFLVELECERYKRHQRSKVEGFSIVDPRDKQRVRFRNPEFKDWNNLMAIQCSSDLTGIPMSTIWGYRRRQSVSSYSSKPFFVKRDEFGYGKEGKQIEEYDYKGKIFVYKGRLLVSPVSTRITGLVLSRA